MMGQDTYQITGEAEEKPLSEAPEINQDDINTVMEKAGVDEEIAKKTLEKNKGDIAQSIIDLAE